MDNKLMKPKKEISPRQKIDIASRNAKLLSDIVDREKWAPVINGKRYLQFEAWQTLGSFYNLVPKVIETKYVEYGGSHGFEARAVVLDTRTNTEVGAGEGICMSDEGKQARNPLYVLKGMAQTRACSRAMRQILAYIAVLAGYEATPSEEMTEFDRSHTDTKPVETPPTPISEAQRKMIFSLIEEKGKTKTDLDEHIEKRFNKKSLKDLTSLEASATIRALGVLPTVNAQIEAPSEDIDNDEIARALDEQ